jgi:hypothetical protein
MQAMQPNLESDLKACLAARGFDRYKTELVGAVVSKCVGLTHAAHERLIETSSWERFLSKKGALSKVSKGIPRVKETAITADIALVAKDLLRNPLVQRRPSLKSKIASSAIAAVVADATMPSVTATGNNSKRPDLVFIPADPELLLGFAVEAKVLETPADCEGVLLGDTGLGCFTRADDPYETNGVIGLYGYAEENQAASHRAVMHAAFSAGKGAAQGCTQVTLADRRCHWDGADLDRGSLLAHMKDPLICLAVVLGFPAIRLATAPSKKTARKTKVSSKSGSSSAAVAVSPS